jgi:glucose-6-phosphate isomerase
MTLRVTTSGSTSLAVAEFLPKLVDTKVASRIAAKDFTIWGKDAEAESSIRLGWVTSASDSQLLVSQILELKRHYNDQGVNRFVLCGMGGSSLAPEVIANTAGVELVVLDSTNPEQVTNALEGDLKRTAVVVSSKSGSTVETDSQKRLFEQAFANAGIAVSERIVVVTDPGSPMEQAAKADGYRIFNADPTVGGRYSALTAFGLVPSGLAGVDIQRLLDQAVSVSELLASDSGHNPALQLGAALARTKNGKAFADKIVIVEDGTDIKGLGDWAEQLIAESTGKLGKGILPIVVTRTAHELTSDAGDQLVVRLGNDSSPALDNQIVVSGNLGAQFLLWEYATVIASYLLEVNPFDQPDVESAKIAARAMLDGREPQTTPQFIERGIEVRSIGFDLGDAKSVESAVDALLGTVGADDYISIHAYLDRTAFPEALELRDLFSARSRRPTTFGWAPRFLHSTGQYHKGGPEQGVFVQIVSRSSTDLAVPGRNFTLGELIASQAAGDAAVLADHKRPVLTFTLNDVSSGLETIRESI